jgi:hypothetical protein
MRPRQEANNVHIRAVTIALERTDLYFVFAGAGPWSVDAMISRARGGTWID